MINWIFIPNPPPMPEVIIILVVIASVVLFLRARRRYTVIYRKKVAPTDRGYSINDHPGVFSPTQHSDHSFPSDSNPDAAIYGALAFEGGEFGGGDAADSYDSGSGSGSAESGCNDSGGSEFCSDSPGSDSSNFSSD